MKKGLIVFILVFTVLLNISSVCSADGAVPATVTDLSDRKYEPALIELLDNAEEAIVVSMYSIYPGAEGKNPVRLLLNDLLEARGRGVSVTIYLNTRYRDADKPEEAFIGSPIYNELIEAGCDIRLMSSSRQLHDKLIIVDNRYVVVGSTNWSNTAFRRNFESNTLIDSPLHAREKLKHIESLLAFAKSNSEISGLPSYLDELPDELPVPKELLTNERYFSRMVSMSDNRVFDLYFLLLAHSQSTGEEKFFINLEDMGLSLGLPGPWTYSALRRQVIKSLRRLESRYNLITVKFYHDKDPLVKLSVIPGDSLIIPSASIIQTPNLTLRLKFLLLIEALLKSEGEDLRSTPKSDLAKRFSVHIVTIREAFEDSEADLKKPAQ